MKIKNLFLALILAVSASQALIPNKVSAQTCDLVFQKNPGISSRTQLVDHLKKEAIPSVLATTYHGESIPVILVNSKTAGSLMKFLENSIGTQVAHQPTWHNDHGLFRFSKTIADMDTPGYRNRGELHATGISWVGLEPYVKAGSRTKRIEVAYSLTPNEMKTANLYSLMRRAAIVRVQFAFGNNTQRMDLPNLLRNGGENCFGFCQASSIDYQVREMKDRFESLNLGTAAETMARPDVQMWLTQVRAKLLSVDNLNASMLNPELPVRVGVPTSLTKNATFQALSEGQQKEALNWLVGLDLTVPYRDLIRELGFQNSGNGFNGMNNKRATAVLIYDAQVKDVDFMSPDYVSEGIFSTWTNKNTTPIEFEPQEQKTNVYDKVMNYFRR